MRALLLTCLLTAGCNSYDAFRISGTQQESFTNRVDLLFVVDNSTSMTAEGAELGLRFDSFITELTGETASSANDLSDAVDNYIDFVNRDASFINFNIGKGWAIGTAPIVTANWKAESGNQWTVPWGLQVSKVTRFGARPVNILLGYYENSQHPEGAADKQVRFQLNLLFPQRPK